MRSSPTAVKNFISFFLICWAISSCSALSACVRFSGLFLLLHDGEELLAGVGAGLERLHAEVRDAAHRLGELRLGDELLVAAEQLGDGLALDRLGAGGGEVGLELCRTAARRRRPAGCVRRAAGHGARRSAASVALLPAVARASRSPPRRSVSPRRGRRGRAAPRA